jgi:hypothetical protein
MPSGEQQIRHGAFYKDAIIWYPSVRRWWSARDASAFPLPIDRRSSPTFRPAHFAGGMFLVYYLSTPTLATSYGAPTITLFARGFPRSSCGWAGTRHCGRPCVEVVSASPARSRFVPQMLALLLLCFGGRGYMEPSLHYGPRLRGWVFRANPLSMLIGGCVCRAICLPHHYRIARI